VSGKEPDHAELILERAFLGALAALVPLPVVDDFLLRRSRATLVRELAARAGLRLDEAALKALLMERGGVRARSLALSVISRALRGAAIPLRVVERARDALETFQLAILLDHYARYHHQGLDLDADRARALRASFDEVIADTRIRLDDLKQPTAHAAALRTRLDERWHGGRA
jgi:hypothetical protein